MLNTDTIHVTQELLALLSEIDEFKGAWRLLGTIAPERLNALRRVATIESIGSSTRIEGSKLTDREVERLLGNMEIRRFSTRDEQEVAGYADVMEAVFRVWSDILLPKTTLSSFTGICSDTATRMNGTAANTRPSAMMSVLSTPTARWSALFETATPFDTPQQMTELVFLLNQRRRDHRQRRYR